MMRAFESVFAIFLCVALLDAAATRAQEAAPAPECLSTSEIRDVMASHKILEPMAAVRSAVRLTHSEPLRSQLCRSNDGLQYELTLLRRDGKVVQVVLNAATGALVANRVPPERPKLDRPKPIATVHAKPPSDRAEPESGERAKAQTADKDKSDKDKKAQNPDKDKISRRPETPPFDRTKTGVREPAPAADFQKGAPPVRKALDPVQPVPAALQ